MIPGAHSGRGFGGSKPLPFLGNFSNMLGFFNKKISKPLPQKTSGYVPE